MPIRVALATRSEDRSGPYLRALETAGLEPIAFAPDSGGSLGGLAGLVLSGGTDVDPALYGAKALPETDTPDRERDDYEAGLLRFALAHNMPVLAICRGQQLVNVVCGGTLIQHLPDTHKHKRNSGGAPVHGVVAEGRMAELFGTKEFQTNSRHHQAVDRVGEGLVVSARDSEDGVVEGVIFPGAGFVVGVQWHPEDMTDDEVQLRLFREFAGAAARNGKMR